MVVGQPCCIYKYLHKDLQLTIKYFAPQKRNKVCHQRVSHAGNKCTTHQSNHVIFLFVPLSATSGACGVVVKTLACRHFSEKLRVRISSRYALNVTPVRRVGSCFQFSSFLPNPLPSHSVKVHQGESPFLPTDAHPAEF